MKHQMLTAAFGMALIAVVSAGPFALPKPSGSYDPGACGVHMNQTQRADNDDQLIMDIFDADHNLIGNCDGGISDASEYYCEGQLPYEISCTQTANTHEVACTYNTPAPYSFGVYANNTGYGCSVGAFDGQLTRQMDCGFSC